MLTYTQPLSTRLLNAFVTVDIDVTNPRYSREICVLVLHSMRSDVPDFIKAAVEKIIKISECVNEPGQLTPFILASLQDMMLNIVIGLLPKSENHWCGVVVRAEQLDYDEDLVRLNRRKLGKYVSEKGLTFVKEKRLCKGKMRHLNLYHVCDELDFHIREYMNQVV